MNYENDIRIDETALDVEWLEQPSLMFKYVKIAANARLELDEAKELLEFTKAELDKQIRMNPEKFGIEKVTENSVFNTILSQESYQDANTNVIKAKYEADVAQGAVRAMEARKDALENLVRLHGLQYFAGPKIPRNIQEVRKEKEHSVHQVIGQRMRTREN